MTYRSSFIALALALMTLAGCTTSGADNTTYSQYQGPSPDAEVNGMRTGTLNAQY